MTRKDDTLWEQGAHCVTLLVLSIINAPVIPYRIRRPLTLFMLLALVWFWLIDSRKRTSYSEGELERERQDERCRMIQKQAVWYCHVAEDWIMLVLFAIFGLFVQNDMAACITMWVLVARCLFSFIIRWWLERKY